MLTKPILCVDEATCLDAFAGGKAPSEVRIFRKGDNDSTKGVFLFDATAAKMVMAKYRTMKRRITWDYDHGALRRDSPNPAETAKSAGSCDLELREGELWAVNINWTPAAKKAIEDGEWPFFSPAFAKDKDNRPTWLINIALTANPSLHDLDELAIAASALSELPELDIDHHLDATLAALRVEALSTAPKAPTLEQRIRARLARGTRIQKRIDDALSRLEGEDDDGESEDDDAEDDDDAE